ncbi:MAG: hypothetical protein ACK4RK_11360 [Gemmataceae bacterium]
MLRCLPLLLILAAPVAARADAFDNYINPVLAKVPGAAGVQEIKQLTAADVVDNDRVLPNITAGFVVVQTNDGRWSKLLVQMARRKVNDDLQVPVLLIDRFVTYREGTERQVQASGGNVFLYNGFQFSLDMGHVVPNDLGGDLRFVAADGKTYLEAIGKAKMYLLTQPLPEAKGTKSSKLVIGESFDPSYFNGTYKLHDDGRRSGTLTLQVEDDGSVTGSYYSDRDGRKYEVYGRTLNSPRHAIQFTVKFPQTEQVFYGMLFTGDGKALAGSSKLQDREAGFYAMRVEEE